MSAFRIDDGDLRDVQRRHHLATLGHRAEFDEHALRDVEALLEETEALQEESDRLVEPDALEEAQKEAATAVADLEAHEVGLRRLWPLMAAEPLVCAVLFAGAEEERDEVLTVALAVVPLFELLAKAHESALQAVREAERSRLYRVGQRKRLVAGFTARMTKAALVDRLAEEELLPALTPEQRALKTHELLASRALQREEQKLVLAKLSKAELAEALALVLTPEPA